jgi:type II secretory pathway component PulL
MSRTVIYLALALLATGLGLTLKLVYDLKQENAALQAQFQTRFHNTAEEASHNELLAYMGYFQRFADKLYFAGKEQNWELAEFYTEELEETAEKLANGNIEDEGVNLSALVPSVLLPSIEPLEKAIKAKDSKAFQENYVLLVNSCNKCHTLAKHPFIRVAVPTSPTHGNQVYRP